MRVTSKGQVTIPRELRALAGIAPNSEVVFGIEGGKVTIVSKDGGREREERERLDRFLAALRHIEGTGDQSLDAVALSRITRARITQTPVAQAPMTQTPVTQAPVAQACTTQVRNIRDRD